MTTSATGARRSITPLALLMTCLGSIIGSGWLFGAFNTAKIAGPAAILAWVIGMVTVLALAFYFWGVRSGDPEAMEEVPQDGD